MINYGKQSIDRTDLKKVKFALKSDFLTSGPKVNEFEKAFAKKTSSKYAIAVCNGTTALHLACLAVGIKEGDEVIATPMTFAASVNCILYCGGKPVFVDIKEENGLIDETKIEEKITKKTKAIIPVHYTGQSCNLSEIKRIAKRHKLIVIEDACHALGGRYKNSKIGSCKYSDMACFSFHPVKHITTGEGGMITTNSRELYEKLKILRNHGITKNPKQFVNKSDGPWYHEMQELGYNYRITDFQCALGLNQLKRLETFVRKRRKIADKYTKTFEDDKNIEIIKQSKDVLNPHHLYIIKVKDKKIRLELFNHLKKNNIFCQVHYIPVYWHPYYKKLGYKKGLCKQAETFYEKIISIPIYPDLKKTEQNKVINTIKQFFKK